MSTLHIFLENGKKNGKILLNETVFGKYFTQYLEIMEKKSTIFTHKHQKGNSILSVDCTLVLSRQKHSESKIRPARWKICGDKADYLYPALKLNQPLETGNTSAEDSAVTVWQCLEVSPFANFHQN